MIRIRKSVSHKLYRGRTSCEERRHPCISLKRKFRKPKKRIHFSEGQMTYIRCARINGIDLLDHLYEKYTREYVSCPHGENTDEYLTTISTILLASEFFDENLCELVSQMIEQNKLYSAKG